MIYTKFGKLEGIPGTNSSCKAHQNWLFSECRGFVTSKGHIATI